jgi:YVTN family beta-propeller protein
MRYRLVALLLLILTLTVIGAEPDTLKLGKQEDGRIVVPTNQILKPAGNLVTFPGRPVDLALADDGKTLVVKNLKDLVFIDIATGKIRQTLVSPAGFSVVGLLVQGERILVTDAKDHVRIAVKQPDGKFQWRAPIPLTKPKEGSAHGAGMAFLTATQLLVATTRTNSVQLVNLETGKVEEDIPVGVAPYQVVRQSAERCYVSNWGGNPPQKGDTTLKTSGTPVRVDPRTNVANDGTVSVLERLEGQWKQTRTIKVGLHPSGMALSAKGKLLYVANANSDTVSVIDTAKDTVVETILCRPEARLPFGSGSNALALSKDGRTLFVANGTNNCIAVVALGRNATEAPPRDAAETSQVAGLIPTAWYPGAVLLSPEGDKILVANVKGLGSLSQPRAKEKGMNSHDHLGAVSIIDLPKEAMLGTYSKEVNANNRLAYSLAGLEKPRPDVEPVPVPARHGEPSIIKHVIYVIKENRTYDQVFGDMKEGDGDKNLCIFGEEVTPNHHALARQFTLFDNFYCSGVLSADGHTWVNEAYVSDYLEKAFGGFTRSYPYEGSDPLAFAASGFLWDNALSRKRTFRNYGEYVKTTLALKTWAEVYKAHATGREVKMTSKPNLDSLAPYTHPGYPGFVMTIPDVYRAELFIADLKEYEKKGEFPNLLYLYLPCDHTSGTRPDSPTPRAMVADNDLALGRCVEAVSNSKFWKDTAIFVVEDDPQNGFDHVDGHRTVALVISPYTKRKFVDHTNYNQTGMVKTIELILGLPPMNQLDLSATAMRNCFQVKPDLTPYACIKNKITLDEMNPPLKKLEGKALHWAKESLALDLDEADEADEDTLNRILWHSVRGVDEPYPERFSAAKRKTRN